MLSDEDWQSSAACAEHNPQASAAKTMLGKK
jgi:hypothetical protein